MGYAFQFITLPDSSTTALAGSTEAAQFAASAH